MASKTAIHKTPGIRRASPHLVRGPTSMFLASLALPFSSALLLAQFAVGAIAQTSPACTEGGFNWTSNSLGQGPCTVAAYLEGVCVGGLFTIPPLLNSSRTYVGPTSANANICSCNTVVYSLISACSACQGATPVSLSSWTSGCSAVSPPSTFQKPIPSGTRVPAWAFLDISPVSGTWNATAAVLAGDGPEATASGVGTPLPSAASGHKPGAGTIAAAVLSGVFGAALIICLCAWMIRRYRSSRMEQRFTTLDSNTEGPPRVGQVFIGPALPCRSERHLRSGSYDVPRSGGNTQTIPLLAGSNLSLSQTRSHGAVPLPLNQQFKGFPQV
ncbi:hypothetical protein BC834DRAFT_603874 [Gloeopeniophorella convolvens]|nr:hypothetical protein BC834DRAFT_603874 [Gloeopeniophorella convolvens]